MMPSTTEAPLAMKRPDRLWLFDVPIDLFTVRELLDHITTLALNEEKSIVTYANVHAMNLASDLGWYRDFLGSADSVFCDGFGLLWGARFLGHSVSRENRMTAPDFLDEFWCACESKELSIYLLGGKPGVVEAAIERLRAVAPSVQVSGHHGYFRKTGPENEAVLADINSKHPRILYVGLGSPLQEQWINDNISRTNATVYLPLGACLDYYTGQTKRGPKWMTDNGAEWLSRLVTEPRRLWSRYFIGNPRFLARVLILRLSLLIRGNASRISPE